MATEFTPQEKARLSRMGASPASARERERPTGTLLLGALLVADGVISELDIKRVLVAQQEHGLRFGEAAKRLGLVKDHHIRSALAVQFDYPIVVEHGAEDVSFDPRLFMACDPFGAQAEALRNLRSELMLRYFDDQRKSLAVVSARKGAGCSSIAANLAVACAQVGERTLLIDADLRRPRLGALFGIADDTGLAGVLGDRIGLKDAVLRVPYFEQLSVLTAGPSVPNPQELLSRLPFLHAMETLPHGFDVIIIDTPPLLECADAQLIAAHAGGTLLVTRRNVTRMDDIEHSKRRLQPSKAELVGMVINE